MVIIRSRIGQDASPYIGIFIDCVLGFIFCVCCFVSDIKMTALLLSGAVDNGKKVGSENFRSFFLFKITLTNLVSVDERLVYTPHPENPEK